MGERYPMCKDQLAQIDCRVMDCRFYSGAGQCSNVSPAITLNTNGTAVCWSKKGLERMDDKKKNNECSTCKWWKQDFGIMTMTGWTGMWRDDGHCHFEPHRIYKKADDCCHNWEADDLDE